VENDNIVILPNPRSGHADPADFLLAHLDRTTVAAVPYLNDVAQPVIWRSGAAIRVRLPDGQSYPCGLSVRDGNRWSKPVVVRQRPQVVEDDNFHRIVESDIELWSDACATVRFEGARAVGIESNEGGRAFTRYFPTARTYAAGDYVEWVFDMNRACDRMWLRDHGQVVEAWSGAAFFAGNVLSQSGDPELVDIKLRPLPMLGQPGDAIPARVTAYYRDGAATWREDVSGRASVLLEDSTIAAVSGEAVVAQGLGRTTARTTFEGRFAESPVEVAALPVGTKYEYFGGVREIREVCRLGPDLLFATATDVIMRISASGSVTPIAKLPMPRTASYGLKLLGVDRNDSIFVQSLWDGKTQVLRSTDSYRRSVNLTFSDAGTMSFCENPDGSFLFGSSDGTIWTSPDLNNYEVLVKLPSGVVGMAYHGEYLYALCGGWRGGYFRIDPYTLSVDWWSPPNGTLRAPGAAASHATGLVMTDFYDGRVYRLRADGEPDVVGADFANPTSLAVGADGLVFVAEFSSDMISALVL
jgi:hypothetical protein